MSDYFTWSSTPPPNAQIVPLTLTGIILNSGDSLQADYGGSAVDTTVNNGGNIYVDNTASGGGTAIGTIVLAAGTEQINGGKDISATLSGGVQFVGSGVGGDGTATDALVLNGGTQLVGSAIGGWIAGNMRTQRGSGRSACVPAPSRAAAPAATSICRRTMRCSPMVC